VVTDEQVRLLRYKMTQGKNQETAAAAAGMSVRSARKWQRGGLPSQTKKERDWRTRPDPFEEVWTTRIEPLLEADAKGELEAKTLMRLLVDAEPERFSMGQLRTMQRRLRDWRALHGPDKEVYFQQEHEPGKEAGIDFTCGNGLGVTIAGEPFPHLLFEFVMLASMWVWVCVVLSESFEALVGGLQGALWELEGVPEGLIMDNLSAASHQLGKGQGRGLNKRFADVCAYLGIEKVRRINVGKAHENGAVEGRHGRTKKLVRQALILRGSADFASVEEYERFVQETVATHHNRFIAESLAVERAQLRPLPLKPVPSYTIETPTVRRWSTIRVRNQIYSVPSRLIGHRVEARVHASKLEIYYAGQLVDTLPRLSGKKRHRIDYRHVIAWLVRKPGAFASYCYREDLYPTLTFRRAYDALVAQRGSRASVEYVRILHLAARASESLVESALVQVLEAGVRFDYATVESLVLPREPEIPVVVIPPPDLALYDELLGASA